MQYYRFLLAQAELSEHLKEQQKGVRYANSCRSVSSRISQDNLSILSGIAAKFLKKQMEAPNAFAGIWSIVPDSLEVKKYEILIRPVNKILQGEWSIIIDQFLIAKIGEARMNKLPNETGGILIGSYDMVRKRVYIVETIISPPGSKEYPNAYIRGIDGVAEKLEDINAKTANNLQYIGEWHSHPMNCSLSPSDDDKILFSWIRDLVKKASRPPLMLILGDNNKYNLIFEDIIF